MARLYVLRTRQPNGDWVIDLDNAMSKKEANKLSSFGRIIGGMVSQIWPLDEAKSRFNSPTRETE